MHNGVPYTASHNIFQDIIKSVYPLPSTPCDHMLILNLYKNLFYHNENENKHPVPLFTPDQHKQILTYSEELLHLIINAFAIDIRYPLNQIPLIATLLKYVPISVTINKKASLFFNQPVSKTTYSILLDYMGKFNMAITKAVVEHLKNIQELKMNNK